jgi:hypothetical protein
MVLVLLLLTKELRHQIILLDLHRCLPVNANTSVRVRVTFQRLKYSRMTSSREANRIGRFQYPGDSKSPSNRVSSLIISKISRSDLLGVVGGVVDLVKALYFCFASMYL